ncbi:hypothetical protein [Corynebacterium bouchesdurhonense]|uniref:hypothetical protein n=1 Tax=Corynebacterium bouchesdurhonense TaxID=1720192 RepID=UPI00082D9C6E|nr:hypothetical protein [Corynebacterium bouchesdurhonense]
MNNKAIAADAVTRAYKDQPTWLRYKGTILIVLTGLASIAGQVATLPEWDGTTVGIAATAAATVITALVNRSTKDGFTPSMVERAADAAPTTTTDTLDDLRDRLAVQEATNAD